VKFLRRLFGLDFPDPEAGQVWRSRHSGRAIRISEVHLSDCGKLWHISVEHETSIGKFNAVPMSYCMFPGQWRWKLRDEGRRLMGGGTIEPSQPWPRGATPYSPPLPTPERRDRPWAPGEREAARTAGVGGTDGR
jgi:hypothetical protein